MPVSTEAVEVVVGEPALDDLLDAVGDEFPDVGDRPAPTRLEELLLLRLANENPAARPLRALVDDTPLPREPTTETINALETYQAGLTPIGPNGETLIEMLRAPARAHPTSLAGQLRYVREHWRSLLGAELDALLDRLLVTLDVIAEEERGLHLRFGGGGDGGAGGGGRGEAPDLTGLDAEPERFSSDSAWMPRLVLIAKSTHVWLDQLSRRYQRDIHTLDAVPDEELDRLARWGITGLWLIGLWERSKASRRIKAWRGNPDAAASAYSLDDYRIADDLGGEAAWADLRHRAWARGVRLASDMVPNHMGIDSHWVIEHPEWFLSLPEPPYPGYTFNGENLAEDERIEIRLEDHYWDNSDAAVVFERRDRWSGDRRYVYHGNDGTSFPWNDTAQLDFTQAAVREQVMRTIVDVARRFPVIRFDAAMVLAKKHVRRLWFPGPGEGGGAIPSRAEFGTMSQADFDAAMPTEFWRDVVDRVAVEAPDTLLLAEAFWLLEGYFVRTLGMHRVYNSAFMHMLRDEDNAGYRRVLKETLEFDPEILKRYVNFMNNPDEKSAAEQFGKGDKYVGVATLLATLPGLPMFGHGQFEGFAEKYGMEFRRASMDEQPDQWLIDRHEREVVPAAPPAGRLRRGARLPAVRRRRRRRGRRRARVRVLERIGRLEVAGRLPQPLRRDGGLDPGLGHVRAEGGRRVEVDGAAHAGGRPGSGRRTGGRAMARDARAAIGPRVPAVGGRDPWTRPARGASRVRDPRVLGDARARRRCRRLGPARGAAGRAGRAVARGRAAGARADAGARRAAGRDRGAGATVRRAAGRRDRRRDRHGRRPGGRRRPGCGASGALAAGHRRHRRPVAGGGHAPVDAGRPAGVAAVGADAGATSRALVRGAAAGAGRGRVAPRPRPRRGRRLAGRRAGATAAGPAAAVAVGGRGAASLPLRLVDAWLADPAVRSFLRVNRWDDAEWFHRESWAELLAWADRLERVTRREDRSAAPSSGRSWPPPAEAAEASGYGSRVSGRRSRGPPSRRLASHLRPRHRPRHRPSRGSRRPRPPAWPQTGVQAPSRRPGRDAAPLGVGVEPPMERDAFTAMAAAAIRHSTGSKRTRTARIRAN